MHLTPKETVEGVTWPSWKIWVSSCSYSTFCFSSLLVTPSVMWIMANAAESWPRVSSHSVLQSKPYQRLSWREVCRWALCVCPQARCSPFKTRPLLLLALQLSQWGNDRSIGAKRAVWSSLIHYCAPHWSVCREQSRTTLAKMETCQPSQRTCVGVGEKLVVWTFSNRKEKKTILLRGDLGNLCWTLVRIISALSCVLKGTAEITWSQAGDSFWCCC